MKYFLILLSFVLISAPASAYLDPGTGSIILQSIIGMIAAAAVFGRTILEQIKSYFRRDDSSHKPDEAASDPEAEKENRE